MMANNHELTSGNNLGGVGGSTTVAEQELVSILKKSGNKQKAGLKATREKIDLTAKVSGGSGSSRKQVYANLQGEEEPSVAGKLKVSRNVGCATTTNHNVSSSPTNSTTVNNKQQKKAQKPRRRVATVAQRRAANIRERRRMFNLNSAFDRLRKKVPSFAYEKRLSRIETLKLAIMYIRFMDNLVNDDDYAEKYKQLTAASSGSSNSAAATTSFLSSGTYLSLYGHHCGNGNATIGSSALLAQDESPSRLTESPIQLSMLNSQGNNLQSTKSLIGLQTLSDQRGFHGCETITNGDTKSLIDFTSTCSQKLGQYCTETNCQSDQQQQQQQQIQQYRARALPASPVSCSSIACCSSPNSSSATTCHSVSSTTFIESSSPNSRSPTIPTAPTQQNGLATTAAAAAQPNETNLYYPNQPPYNLHSYAHQQHHQVSITARCLYPSTSDSYEQQNPVYYNNTSAHQVEPAHRKPLDNYHHNYHQHHQGNPLLQDHDHQHLNHQYQQQHQLDGGNQHEQRVYSLHSLEAI